MNKITLLNNKYAQIETDNPNLRKEIDSLLSYKLQGVEYLPLYKNTNWDGFTHLLTAKNKFPIGLTNKIKKHLKKLNIETEIIDNRYQIPINEPLDISKKLISMEMPPRDYQLNAVKAISENSRGIIRAATGSGKTLIAALITAYLNKSTTIYVIGLDLLKQFHDLFSSIFDEEIGYIGNRSL
jgi:hypothetical protein